MDINNKVIVLSIREGIKYCIDNGIESAVKQLEIFDKNGKLATNQKTTLQKNLECLADEVTVTGGGKSGQVILTGIKESPTERVTGNARNGKKLKEYDQLLKEYLFFMLCKVSYPNYTTNQLVELVNLLPIKKSVSEAINCEINSIFKDYLKENQISYIYRRVEKYIDSRKREDVQLYIKHLEAEEKIKVKIKYNAKYRNYILKKLEMDEYGGRSSFISYYTEISEELFNEHTDTIKQIVNSHGYKYRDYFKAVMGLSKIDESIKKILSEVNEYYKLCGYEYIFTSFDITVLQHNLNQQHFDFQNAFTNKLIDCTNSLMKKEDYKNQTSYTNEFFRLAMFVALKNLGVQGLDEVIEREVSQVPDKCHEIRDNYFRKQAEKEAKPEKFAW